MTVYEALCIFHRCFAALHVQRAVETIDARDLRLVLARGIEEITIDVARTGVKTLEMSVEPQIVRMVSRALKVVSDLTDTPMGLLASTLSRDEWIEVDRVGKYAVVDALDEKTERDLGALIEEEGMSPAMDDDDPYRFPSIADEQATADRLNRESGGRAMAYVTNAPGSTAKN